MVSYKALNVGDPMAVAIDATGIEWGSLLVKFGAVFGLATVMLVMLLGPVPRLFSMSRDGLLEVGRRHPSQVPHALSLKHPGGVIVAFLPALLPIDRLSELVNMGTLLAFSIVSAGVWILRRRHPDLHRPFKTPWVPAGADPRHRYGFLSHLELPALTKEVVVLWLLVGLVIYFTYSVRHSKSRRHSARNAK